ncbi:MAG TPA: hypothetical protein VMU96_10230 [Casimicrobiaceae bacterium]|nr:hypothetical protein [Casimicrobiaceae bacterium]
MMLPATCGADFELTAPDGDRILLKDDGTWVRLKKEASDGPKEGREAVLRLESKTELGVGCRYLLRLQNDFPYEIRSIVPAFFAYRPNGVIYDTQSVNFNTVRPGDSQTRQIQFLGIACKDIARLQVGGGDRCELGELDRFSNGKGECLSRVRVVASDLVQFDK